MKERMRSPRGGDELNLVKGGRNYGWPVITYGREYSGKPVGQGITQQAGMEQPVYDWDPVIAPSGMAFYEGDLFPAWKGSLFIGSLRQKHLVRLSIKDGKVTGEERPLTEVGERIRAVIPGPDGALDVLTEPDRGRVLKIVPKPGPWAVDDAGIGAVSGRRAVCFRPGLGLGRRGRSLNE